MRSRVGVQKERLKEPHAADKFKNRTQDEICPKYQVLTQTNVLTTRSVIRNDAHSLKIFKRKNTHSDIYFDHVLVEETVKW